MQTIEANGESLAYVTSGTGSPLLLLHGIGAGPESWSAVTGFLGQRYAASAVALRGHAGSSCNGPIEVCEMANDIAAAADTLGLRSFHLAGVSLGAAVALNLAASAPERVQSLVLCGLGAQPSRALADEIYGIREAVHYLAPEDFARQVAEALLTPDAPTDAVEGLEASIAALTKQRYLQSLEAMAETQPATIADRVRAPTLVLHGALDELVPAEQADALAAAIRGARRADLENAGHLANLDDPAGFAASLERFFAETVG